MIPQPVQTDLLVFHENLELIEASLKTNVVRMAASLDRPQDPLRPTKEIIYDETGRFVLPESRAGISLAASVTQLLRVFRPKRTNYLLLVDRNSALPRGFSFNKESGDHWMIVVTEKMPVETYNKCVHDIIQKWVLLGKFVRYD